MQEKFRLKFCTLYRVLCFTCCKKANKKAIIKTAIIALNGMKDVPIGLLLSLRVNNNAPIASFIRTFMSQNLHIPKAFDVFLYGTFSYTNFISHIIGCD